MEKSEIWEWRTVVGKEDIIKNVWTLDSQVNFRINDFDFVLNQNCMTQALTPFIAIAAKSNP